MSDKIVNHFVLADGSVARYDYDGLLDAPEELVQSLDLSSGTNGKFILASNGNVVDNVDFKISEPFHLSRGEKVKLTAKGYSTNVAMISKANSNSTYTPLVISIASSTVEDYEYTATGDIDIVFCFNINYSYLANLFYLPKTVDSVLKDEIDVLEETLSSSFQELFTTAWENVGETVTGKQVHVYNGVISIANGNENYKYVVQDVTDYNRVKVHCNAGQNVNYSIGYVFATSSGAVVSQYNNTYGEYILEVDVPEGANILYVNNNGSTITPSIAREINVAKRLYFDLSLFEKFGVIGDSYASGELYYNSEYVDKYSISWGQILARKHGITCTNYSKGGLTTRSWLTDSKGLPLMLSSPAEDLYLLVLGINDYYQLGQSYLGTLEDITSHTSYVDYADTFYGNYGKIIEQIQSHAPHAKIVMSTVANTNALPQMFSDAVIEIAGHYNIPYVVQADDPYFNSTMYQTMSGGHPTAIGYSGMATAFENMLDNCVKDNISYFFDAFMYD